MQAVDYMVYKMVLQIRLVLNHHAQRRHLVQYCFLSRHAQRRSKTTALNLSRRKVRPLQEGFEPKRQCPDAHQRARGLRAVALHALAC